MWIYCRGQRLKTKTRWTLPGLSSVPVKSFIIWDVTSFPKYCSSANTCNLFNSRAMESRHGEVEYPIQSQFKTYSLSLGSLGGSRLEAKCLLNLLQKRTLHEADRVGKVWIFFATVCCFQFQIQIGKACLAYCIHHPLSPLLPVKHLRC